MKKILRKGLAGILIGVMVAGSSMFTAFAAEQTETKYNKVEEIFDWGAATTKVIVDTGQEIASTSIPKDAFSVKVKRTDSRVKEKPVLEEGDRTVKNAYISDETGNKSDKGNFITLELAVGPTVSIGSPLNYYDGSNVWIDCEYTITQKQEIKSGDVVLSGLSAKTLDQRFIPQVDKFSSGSNTYKDAKFGEITLSYADFKPSTASDNNKRPMVIWLHGGGEGGTDPTIAISANKACNLASDEIQNYFKGAYVLAPQTPTYWMDNGKGAKTIDVEKLDGTTMYTAALKDLIDNYIKQNPGVDTSRIYIGGCSNGGFMTMQMIIAYPQYFAAAYPVCEGLGDKFVTDENITAIKDMPIWFIHAATDTTLPAPDYTLPTYDRLIKAGAKNVHLTYFKNVVDETGLYKNADGSAHEYDGHWSWIYAYNNKVTSVINGKSASLMEWMAAQKR